MNMLRPAANRYRAILIASLVSSGSLLQLLPALADQNSPTPGTLIENQATATFTDSADNTPQTALSDKVSVAIAEVAGISATGSDVVNPVYRTNIVYFDFLVKNEGNDPTQLFVPAAPSNATYGGVAIPAGNIGQLQVIAYNDATTTTTIPTGAGVDNLVNTSTGSATGSLTSVPNGGSVPPGGYIKVRVPITVPFDAVAGQTISITLGNTNTPQGSVNVPYIVGATGTGTNDLYTQDNGNGAPSAPGTTAEANGAPINGDAANNRQEASAIQTAVVVPPPTVTISGTAWDDANGSGTATFTGIQNNPELGANVVPAITAILVDSLGNVVANTPVTSTGTYTFDNIPGVQNSLYVILSTTTGVVGTQAPAPSLPPAWAGTTPLTRVTVPFDVGIVAITGQDFGIEQLPNTTPVVAATTLPNPPGTVKYQVPTLKGTDPEDDVLGSITTFKIVDLPLPAQGILYYDSGAGPVAVTAGQLIPNYDPTKLTFDPANGDVTMSFTYVSVDAAGKEDLSPATATMTFSATPVGISGTVYNDKNNSANNTFTNIQSPGEVGTDAVFGTTVVPVNAILVNIATGLVIGSQVVSPTGLYSFTDVPANTDVKIILSPTPLTIGSTAPVGTAPVGWVGTSPKDSGTFNSGLLPITDKDFGIRQKAKLVLVKRITKINGQTTNPNDGTDLTVAAASDTFNNVGNWPAGYLVGSTNAGRIQPKDTIEYTVYFLNNQGANATNVKICDPIKGVQDYVANSIKLRLGAAGSDSILTDITDTDSANVYATGNTPLDCNASAATSVGADKGGVAIGFTGVTGATGVATPSDSYGLFRFTTKVQP
jgi:hypothetical protein